MTMLLIALAVAPIVIGAYAYFGYPLLLAALGALRPRRAPVPAPEEWPLVTLTVPVYNEAQSIREKLEDLFALDYPEDRRHILVISDASTDGTDEIVGEYADRGVELLRLSARGGKSAAENAAGARLRGALVVNTDATIRLEPGALKALVQEFGDPTVGVVSGRDVSIGARQEGNGGEAGYVDYEMWIRSLESRIDSIVGASGCFYGIRASIYDARFPDSLSRDFASALMAREHGYRAVSADRAICYVPRARGIRAEFRRKIRTMARGIQTLWYKRHLMNPFRHGVFAWMLVSHKLCRWLVTATLPLAVLAMLPLAVRFPSVLATLGVAAIGLLLGAIGFFWSRSEHVPRPFAVPGFLLASTLAGVLAWLQVARGQRSSFWEPTRRPT